MDQQAQQPQQPSAEEQLKYAQGLLNTVARQREQALNAAAELETRLGQMTQERDELQARLDEQEACKVTHTPPLQ